MHVDTDTRLALSHNADVTVIKRQAASLIALMFRVGPCIVGDRVRHCFRLVKLVDRRRYHINVFMVDCGGDFSTLAIEKL